MIYTTPHFSIYFGDASDQLYQHEYLSAVYQTPLSMRQPYAAVCKQLKTTGLTFCHQTHSTQGYIALQEPSLYPVPFAHQGDYLITNQSLAIGVMTADCLPIILYDSKTHSVGIVHAGWRGMVMGIIAQAITHMEQTFRSCAADMQVIFGPSAHACCYNVTAEFKEHFLSYAWHDELFLVREEKLFCDLILGAVRILHECGVDQKAIVRLYNECTVCTMRYCSYRRDKERAGRQMTVVALHNA